MNNVLDVVSIDNGLMNLKGKSKHGEIIYQNRHSEGFTDNTLKGNNTFNTRYGTKMWTIGENGRVSQKLEGKDSEFHVVSCLTAITRLFPKEELLFNKDKDDKKIVLIYFESMNRYFNEEHKRKIKTLFEGTHRITVDEEEFMFTIELCHILPEGIGHILTNLRAYSGVRVSIDMGGGTVNYVNTINGRPTEDSFSVPLGMHNIVAKVSKEISKAKQGHFDDNTIKDFIRYGCSNSEINRIVELLVFEQFEELDNTLAGFGVDIHKLLEVDFIGGTSQEFSSQIRKYYANARVHEEGIFSNVRGGYEYGRVKFTLK